jgi:hypothetical protein
VVFCGGGGGQQRCSRVSLNGTGPTTAVISWGRTEKEGARELTDPALFQWEDGQNDGMKGQLQVVVTSG